MEAYATFTSRRQVLLIGESYIRFSGIFQKLNIQLMALYKRRLEPLNKFLRSDLLVIQCSESGSAARSLFFIFSQKKKSNATLIRVKFHFNLI